MFENQEKNKDHHNINNILLIQYYLFVFFIIHYLHNIDSLFYDRSIKIAYYYFLFSFVFLNLNFISIIQNVMLT